MKRSFSALGITYNEFNPTQLSPVFGDTTGLLYQERLDEATGFNIGGQTTDTLSAISYKIETPAITYGSSVYQKTITGVSVDIREDFNPSSGGYGELDFSYGGRGIPGTTLTFTNTLGSKLGSFTLGTDQLGGDHDIFHYAEDVQGEGKAFVYTLVEDSALDVAGFGTDVVVDHFSILLTPSGESMENG